MALFRIGQRIVDTTENARGTVKYLGSVEGTKGDWIGIDWDDSNRGKHDGSHKGKKYFFTKTETSGSFVRATKISSGVTFENSIADRYGGSADADPELLENIRRDINAPFLQLVGFEKVGLAQSNYSKLKTISVRNMGVYGSGDNLESYAVANLDIAENLFDSWDTISKMCKQLKKLKNLNVSESRLSFPENQEDMVSAFSNLQTLFMGRMDYDWNQCQRNLEFMKNLQVLHIYENPITQIPTECNVHTLVELNLGGCPLKEWSNLMKLSKLPKLQKLVVNRCELEEISLEENETGFAALTGLQIQDNKLKNWQSIFCLNFLPILQDLKYKGNPIIESEPSHTSRQIVIASIGTLKVANGTEIERVERFGSEIDFLKKYGVAYLDAVSKNGEILATFHKNHPRYKKLVEKFGAPEESELRVRDTSLKANLLKINFKCPDSPEVATLTKSLPPAMVVSKLQGLLTRLIKPARGKTVKLSYISAENPDMEVPFDNDMRDLFFYNVESGDTVYVRW